MRKFVKFTFIAGFVTLIVGLAACDQLIGMLTDQEQPMPSVAPQSTGIDGEISIGLLYPMTGRLAVTGAQMKEGFDLALDEINQAQRGNASLKFITMDDTSDVPGAVEAFNQLIQQGKVPAIIGPTTSSQAKQAFPISQANQIVAISPTSAATGLSAIGDFVFRVTLTSDAHIPNTVRASREKLGYKKVALIYDELHAIAVSGANAFRKALTENNVEILITETFQTGDTDLTAQLARIREARPDAIFMAALPEDFPGIMIQARDLGIPSSVPFILPELSITDVRAAGAAAEGLIASGTWLSDSPNPINQAFVQNYQARYGVKPNTWAAHAYASVYILVQAIADASSADSQAIRDAMANIKNLDTVLGRFSFNADGDAVRDAIVLTVEDGEFKIFE